MQPRFRPRSALGRAVAPVVGGLLFFALLGAATWGIAAVLSGNPERVEERLAETQFEVGNAEFLSNLVAEDGPLLFQGLVGDTGERSIVLGHSGDDPSTGWSVRWAFPADRDDTCTIRQVPGTADFVDCDERTIGYDDLARPTTVRPIVSDVVVIDLRGGVGAADPGTEPPATTSE